MLLVEVELKLIAVVIVEVTIEFNQLIMLNYWFSFDFGLMPALDFDFAQYPAQYLMFEQTQKHSQNLLQPIVESFVD